MRKKLLFLLVFSSSKFIAQTTVWEKSIGSTNSEVGSSIIQVNTKNYTLFGRTLNSLGNYDFNLVKVDTAGNEIFNLSYDSNIGTKQDEGYDVIMASDSSYVMAGSVNVVGGVNSDMFLVKTDKNGTLIWQKRYGGASKEIAKSITTSLDGGFVFAGYTSSFGKGGKDFYVFKINANGDSIWSKTFGSSLDDEAFSVNSTKDGGYLVTGYNFTAASYKKGVVMKLSANGDSLWSNYLDFNPGDATVYDAVEDPTTGNVYVTGSFFGDTGTGTKDHVLIAKMNSAGTLIGTASKILPNTTTIRGVSIAMGNNSLAITGILGSDVMMIRIDTNTVKITDTYYGSSTGIEDASKIIQDMNGDYLIIGSDSQNSGNFYLIKFYDCLDLSVSVNSTLSDSTASFTSNVSGNHGGSDVYNWSGQDGFSSSSSNPSHTYSIAGTYTYSLTYTDSRACSKTISANIVVAGVDADNDGFSSDVDCDDNNTFINPGALDIPNNGIDEDCSGTDASTISIEELNSTFTIYPNPSNEYLLVKSDITLNTYQIITINGVSVKNGSLENSNLISLKNLDKGTYYLKFDNTQNSVVRFTKF